MKKNLFETLAWTWKLASQGFREQIWTCVLCQSRLFFKSHCFSVQEIRKKPMVVNSKLTFCFSVLNLALGFKEIILLFLMSS